MGQSIGSLRSHRVIRSNGQLILEQHSPPELLEFTPEQSQMISYGIDRQTNPKFIHKSLPSLAGYDAKSLAEIFKKTVCLPSANISCNVASLAPHKCTFEGMHQSFMEAASKVDTNGIFVFYFAGHGLKIKGSSQSNDEWGLVPSNYDCTRDTFITANTLVSWLQYVRFQGRYAFFILDCCYASGIGEQLVTGTVETEIPIPGLFVLTACTALESSLVVSILEHSIFNFFLAWCLHESYYCQKGRLAIKEVYEECETCCLALSSLLIAYDSKLKLLKWNMMQPEMKYFHLTEFIESLLNESDTTEQTDSSGPGRFQFALEYYKSGTKKSVIIPDKCQAWLEIVSQPKGPLDELHKRQHIDGKMLTAIVASMMYSMASFFIACQQLNITSSNTFIVSFLHVAAAIDRVHNNISLTINDLKICLEFYVTALDKHKITSGGELRSLYNTICRDISNRSDSTENTDSASPHTENEDNDIAIHTEWIPSEWTEEPQQH